MTSFRETAGQYGHPASVLSDNAMYYTARFARGGRTGLNRFEMLLAELGIEQKHSRPNHPTTCGKVTLRYNSRLHKIGIGREHAGTPITMLITDRDIRFIATTPARRTSPPPHTRPHPGLPTHRKTEKLSNLRVREFPMSNDITLCRRGITPLPTTNPFRVDGTRCSLSSAFRLVSASRRSIRPPQASLTQSTRAPWSADLVSA